MIRSGDHRLSVLRHCAAALLLWLGSGCGDGAARPSEAASAITVEAREEAIRAIQAQLAADRVGDAAVIARRLHTVRPEDPMAMALLGRVQIAEAAIAGGDAAVRLRAEALPLLSAAIARGIDDPETLSLAAALAEGEARFREAEAWRRRVVASPGATSQARLQLAWNLWRQERREEAWSLLDEVRSTLPDLPLAHAFAGQFRLEAGDRGGLGDLAAARRLDPEDLSLRLREVAWRRRFGDLDEAALLIAALPETVQGTLAVARESAAVHLARADPNRAAQAWELAIRAAPASVEAHLGLVEACLAAASIDRAADALHQAALLDPTHPDLAGWRDRLRSHRAH